MRDHAVRLPHPDKREATVGICDCGWTVIYRWGEHGEAVSAAGEHIEREAQTEWIEIGTVAGDRTVLPGRSL